MVQRTGIIYLSFNYTKNAEAVPSWKEFSLRDHVMHPFGIRVFLISCLSFAGTIQAQSCPPPVGLPNTVLSDADILKTEFPDGTTATFKCEVGYEPIRGSSLVTCSLGTWSPLKLQCEKKECGSPGEIINGEFNITGIAFGDRAVAICNPGYMLASKDNVRICMEGGWTNRVPVCEVVKCNPPPPIENGVGPSKEVYAYREVVEYKCLRNYHLNGSSSLTCLNNGQFSPDPPSCIKVECENPAIDNAIWDGGSQSPYTYKSSVTHRCKTGFHPAVGSSSTSTCTLESKWSPPLMTCEKIPVTPKPPTAATTTTTTKSVSPITPKGSTPPEVTPNNNTATKVVIGIFCALAVIAVAGLCYYCYKKKSRTKRSFPVDGPL